MAFQLTEEQVMMRNMAREFAQKEIAPRDKWMDENGFDEETHKKFVETGLAGLHIPEAYGGADADPVTVALVMQELARASGSFATAQTVNVLTSKVLAHATEEQKQKYLGEMAAGKRFAFSLTESTGGSDAGGALMSTCIKQEDGTWLLNGSKAWITNIGIADYYVVLAKTDPAAGTRGISAFIMPKDVQGLTVGRPEDKMGMRGSNTGELSFDNIALPEDALIGEVGRGFAMAMQALDGGRVNAAAICTGIAKHAYEIGKDYAKTRMAFGKPISKFQGISFKFADMSMKLNAMELLTLNAANMMARGERCTVEAAQAKLYASTEGLNVCLDAQQTLGGNGYSKEYHVERLVRDIRMFQFGEGTTEILKVVIGGSVFA